LNCKKQVHIGCMYYSRPHMWGWGQSPLEGKIDAFLCIRVGHMSGALKLLTLSQPWENEDLIIKNNIQATSVKVVQNL
jgi:hypothetical protein